MVGGRKLFRKIQLKAWSQKVNLSGRNVGDVRLRELCWPGWRNWHVRLLSAGQFVTVAFCRKVNEAVLMSQLLTYIRERKWDIDQIAQAVGSSSNLPIASSSSSSENPNVQASQSLANYIGRRLEQFANTVVENDKGRQIADLKRQLEQAKSSSPTEPGPSEAMERFPKRTRLATKRDATANFRDQVLDFLLFPVKGLCPKLLLRP